MEMIAFLKSYQRLRECAWLMGLLILNTADSTNSRPLQPPAKELDKGMLCFFFF
jgi:hypothetical protein